VIEIPIASGARWLFSLQASVEVRVSPWQKCLVKVFEASAF